MSSRSSRRVPWPWDARIATTAPPTADKVIGDLRGTAIGSWRGTLIGHLRGTVTPFGLTQGLMLLTQPDGSLMISRKQTNLESLYPATAEYDSAPVYRERTFMFRPSGGLGEPIQAAAGDRRYHYGINVWVTGGLFGKGPLSHTVLPAGTASVANMCRRFIEAKNAGAEALFYITQQVVKVRTDDSASGQTTIRARSAHQPWDMARFTGAFTSAPDALYVAWEDGLLEEYNGAAWNACVLPTGFLANFLERLNDELWAADSAHSVIRKCSADPKVATNWGGPILVGTPSVPITAIRASSNRLVVFKADGSAFTLNANGSVNDEFPGLLTSKDIDNGRTAVAWLDSLWFRSGRAWYQLDGNNVLTPRGPGRNLGNLSEVRGPVQAFSGWNTQMAFAGIYNQDLHNSYILSYGSWVPKADPSGSGVTVSGTAYTFVDQYDGALVRYIGRQVTSLFVSNIPTEARLYIGFLDGGFEWIKLVPYPLILDQGGEYTLDVSYLVLPLHHAMFQADNKHWTGASIFGPALPIGTSVSLEYQVRGQSVGTPTKSPGGGDYMSWHLGQVFDQNGERLNPEPPIAGKALDLKVNLLNSSNIQTPVLEGLGLHERLVPSFRRDYTLGVNANDYVARRDGASTRQSGKTIRKWMEDAASAPASITLELPDESLNSVALFSYEERQVPHTQRGGLGWGIMVQATQFDLLEIYGIIGRLRGTRIGDLRGYKISDLKFL